MVYNFPGTGGNRRQAKEWGLPTRALLHHRDSNESLCGLAPGAPAQEGA